MCPKYEVRISFTSDFETESYKANGYYAYEDFYQLGLRVGLPEAIVKREIELFHKTDAVESFIHRSFLDDDIKKKYRGRTDRLSIL